VSQFATKLRHYPVFALLVVVLAIGIRHAPEKDIIPSPLIGKPAPHFALPDLADPAHTDSRGLQVGAVLPPELPRYTGLRRVAEDTRESLSGRLPRQSAPLQLGRSTREVGEGIAREQLGSASSGVSAFITGSGTEEKVLRIGLRTSV
jgi:hypothetical protein